MAQSGCNTRTGISMAIIETFDYLEEKLNSKNIFFERERLTKDKLWVHKVLFKNPGIKYVRVVTTKPEGGSYIKRRYYFDAFLVQRMLPGTQWKVWMLYLVPINR